MPKRPLQLDVTTPPVSHEPMTSKSGSCSPPSLASSDKPDAEIDDSKEIFFQELKRRFKNLRITEEEMNLKIKQMWDTMSDQNRQTIIKTAQSSKLKVFKVPEIPPFNPKNQQTKRSQVNNQINNNDIVKNTRKLPSPPLKNKNSKTATQLVRPQNHYIVPRVQNVLPPPIRTGTTYSDKLKQRMKLCNLESSNKSHLIPGLIGIIPRAPTPPPPSFVIQEEDLDVNCGFPRLSHAKREQKPSSDSTKILVNTKEIVKKEEEPDEVRIEPPPSALIFKKVPPAPKWSAPPQKNLENTNGSLGIVPGPKKRKLPVNNKIKAYNPNPSIKKTEPSRSRMVQVRRVTGPPKKQPDPVNKDELEIKKMPFKQVCEHYYLGLCQPLLRKHDEKPLTKYNQQSLANVVEGWKLVREYRGIL